VFVALDVGATMKRLRAPRVTDPASTDENKAAIDGVWRRLRPDYLVLLGSVDVIPHQRLINPVHDGDDDPDEDPFVPSDLPYACDAPHSLDATQFIGPTRVVGRLPDLTGARDPDYLLAVLSQAAGWESRPRSEYARYFAVSAWVWRRSTARTLVKLTTSSHCGRPQWWGSRTWWRPRGCGSASTSRCSTAPGHASRGATPGWPRPPPTSRPMPAGARGPPGPTPWRARWTTIPPGTPGVRSPEPASRRPRWGSAPTWPMIVTPTRSRWAAAAWRSRGGCPSAT